MRTRASREVAAGHFVANKPVVAIKVDGKTIDLTKAADALEVAETRAQSFSKNAKKDRRPGRVARMTAGFHENVAKPVKSFTVATIATVGSWFPKRNKTGDAAVHGAVAGAAVGRAKEDPKGIKKWLGQVAENANYARLVGLEVLASYHPDRVSELHEVELELEGGETYKAHVEVIDHKASFFMNKLIVGVSGCSIIPPGFPTGLITFGTNSALMLAGSLVARLTGHGGLAGSMQRLAGESAVLAPVALGSLAADVVYVGASAVHLSMHQKISGAPIVRELSDEEVKKRQGSMKERIAEAKKKASRQLELTKKAKALAAEAPELLEHLEHIATEEAQNKLEKAIRLHERAVRAAERGFENAAGKLDAEAEHLAEEAIDAKRVAILTNEARRARTGEQSPNGSVIGRIVHAEQDRPVPDTDGEPIDKSTASEVLDVLAPETSQPTT